MYGEQYMTKWGEAFAAAQEERAYATALQNAAQDEWHAVMYAGDHFEGGFDEALMVAQQAKKMVFGQADDHNLRAGATDDTGHIAADTVSRVQGLWNGGI